MSENERLLANEAPAFSRSQGVKYFNIVIESGKGATVTDADGKNLHRFIAAPPLLIRAPASPRG